MDLLALAGYDLRGLATQNIVLGKNGCGKSRLLKTIEQNLRTRPDIGAVRYISPERAGVLQYEANVEQNITTNIGYLADSRRQNQAQQFRQQSAAQFRKLELLVLREIEKNPTFRNDPSKTFDTVVEKINTLLDRIYIKRGDPSFTIHDRKTDAIVGAAEVSSGESELVSLGIECLVFARECIPERLNLLLLDEPDVHLHPDLQARFARFLMDLVKESPISFLLATHSTAFLGAMSANADTRIAFMQSGQQDLNFVSVGYTLKRILPVFGAHPLSNVFNEAPVLLVEGEDDERIWQQAVRSGKGIIAVYPVSVDSVTQLSAFESEVAKIIGAVYDGAVGYSLRDRDDDPAEIGDIGPVKRFRLNSRAAENLLLSADVLARENITWAELQTRITTWISNNPTHPHFSEVSVFAQEGFDRRNADLKVIRNDLVGLMGSNKPWEILVGQAIAALARGEGLTDPDSLREYLGNELCDVLLKPL